MGEGLIARLLMYTSWYSVACALFFCGRTYDESMMLRMANSADFNHTGQLVQRFDSTLES